MKRAAYLLLCLLTAAGGIAAGRTLRPAEPSAATSEKPAAAAAPAADTTTSAAAKKPPPQLKGYDRLRHFLHTANSGDVSQLPAQLKACDGDLAALYLLMDTWMRRNPEAFIRAFGEAMMKGERNAEQSWPVMSDALKIWAQRDLDQAITAAQRFPGSIQRFVMRGLISEAFNMDADKGMKLAAAFPYVNAGQATQELMGRKELLPLIRQLPPNTGRTNMMEYALRGTPLTEALQIFSGTTEYMDATAFSRYLRNAKLPAAELTAAWETVTGHMKYNLATTAAETLTKEDPAAAVEWIDGHLSGSRRNHLLQKIADLDDHPAAAEAAQALLPDKPAKEKAPKDPARK